jgi:archaellum component FlaC
MVEDIWKFLQPKMDEKFDQQTKKLDEIKKQLDRIEERLSRNLS